MKEMQSKTIDEINYNMYSMNPFKAAAILARITKIIGGPMATMMAGAKGEEGQSILDGKVSGDVLGLAMEELTKKLHEKEVVQLMKDLLVKDLITCGDVGSEEFKKITNPENHFQKHDVLHLFKVVKFSLEVNFGNFFAGLADLKD